MLTAARLGAAAAFGLTEIEVYARPRVAILPTGDEVVEPGGTLGSRTDLRRQHHVTHRAD